MARMHLDTFFSYLPFLTKEGYSKEMIFWRRRGYMSMFAFLGLMALAYLLSILWNE